MSKQPNFLFLFPDQHRGDWMPYPEHVSRSFYGMQPLPLRMPHIEALMERGVTFTRAVTPCPLCAPARACLAAGLRYEESPVQGNHEDYPPERRTFYSVLKENGYEVGGVGKFDLHKATHWWGLDGWIDELGQMGFTAAVDNAGKIDAITSGKSEPKDPYMNYLYSHGLAELHIRDMKGRKKNYSPTDLPEEAYCDNWLSTNGIDMLRNFSRQKPWFLVVNFTGPHSPFDVTRRMREEWENFEFPLPHESTDEVAQSVGIRQNYAAMLENIDRNIGLLLQEIDKRGELENTIIIYTSDHGEMLGDFDRYGKTRPERGSVHIPLVVAGPGVRAGLYSDSLVELQDLTRTMVELAGADMPEAVSSVSLLPMLQGNEQNRRKVQISAYQGWKIVSDGRFKLIIEEGEQPRLYDITTDPWESKNIASLRMDLVAQLNNHL